MLWAYGGVLGVGLSSLSVLFIQCVGGVRLIVKPHPCKVLFSLLFYQIGMLVCCQTKSAPYDAQGFVFFT